MPAADARIFAGIAPEFSGRTQSAQSFTLIYKCLTVKDLTSDGVWDEYDTLTWSHGQICGVFKNNVAQAMVIRQHARGGSGRGLRFGDNEGKTEDLYPEEKPDITFADAPATTGRSRSSAKRIKIYRFNKLGVGFEGRDHKVTSMSIFPPKPD